MTPAAAEHWVGIYTELAKGAPGLLGAITARAEAQTIRLALIYALLDQAVQIDVVHLDAALAVWRFCEASARCGYDSARPQKRWRQRPVADRHIQALWMQSRGQ